MLEGKASLEVLLGVRAEPLSWACPPLSFSHQS
jgi:hypothetical protein